MNETQKSFFNEYKTIYNDFCTHIKSETKLNEKEKKEIVKSIMFKLTFLQFIQKKGWFNCEKYLFRLFNESRQKNDFYNKVLKNLFSALNNNSKNLDEKLFVENEKITIPYLNCDYFESKNNYNISFPEKCFNDLFNFFEKYEFYLDEFSFKENCIDPETLGYVFENLLEDNKNKGTFYTPKEIVQYMCEESIIAYLGDTEENRKLVKEFDVSYITDKKALLEKLKDVKICDPAIGSGAFPMGMLNILYHLRMILEGKEFTSENIVKVKKDIIQNNIYGVDIEAGAVDIARLRFWLSIVVDEDKPIPLPNLDYKIMQGNSLKEEYNGVDLSEICNFMTPEKIVVKQVKRGKKQQDSNEATLLELFDDTLCTPEVMHKAMDYYFSIQQHTLKKQYKDRINGKVLNCIKSASKQENITIDWENKTFFLWHTYFWDVFHEKGGFDIIIGNPPYCQISRNSNEYSACLFPFSHGKDRGKQNLYKLFIELCYNHTKNQGITNLIVQSSFMCDSSANYTRKLLLKYTELKQVIEFPKLSDGKKVFDNVLQGTCIILMQKHIIENSLVKISSDNNVDVINSLCFEEVSSADILSMMPDDYHYIPLVKSGEWEIVKKILEKKQFAKQYFMECSQGDLNLTTDSKNFSKDETSSIRLYRGKHVQKYHILTDVNEFVKDGFKSDIVEKNKNVYGLCCQQITGTTDRYRLHFAILPNNNSYLLGNSINKIIINKDINKDIDKDVCIKFLLGVLNSKFMDWFFRKFSTNNHVNCYQLEQLPMPSKFDFAYVKEISSLVKKLFEKIADNKNIETEVKRIDDIVYKLYGLTDEEISVVEQSFKPPVKDDDKNKKNKKVAAIPATP